MRADGKEGGVRMMTQSYTTCAQRASVVARVFYNSRGPRRRQPLTIPLHTDVVKGDVVVGRVSAHDVTITQ
jgi:hypothetical protein